ncbi:MAG: GNAT family N-acetyltransferase [Bacteroidetes bacterium]|nr:GNAT family N-acetyltransferase [Bacteroidota bacterium]
MTLHWVLKSFDELTTTELYSILQLRNEVFVVEQNCPYQDADNKDFKSYHLMGWMDDTLAAYTRIIPQGISYAEASIGRVVTKPAFRGTGAGKVLMQRSIAHTLQLFQCTTIRIGAQLYLKKFYEALGFVQCSSEYLEDNIPHIEMLLAK